MASFFWVHYILSGALSSQAHFKALCESGRQADNWTRPPGTGEGPCPEATPSTFTFGTPLPVKNSGCWKVKS